MELKYYAGKDVLDALLDCMERISKKDGADVVEVVRCKDCKNWNEEGRDLDSYPCRCALLSWERYDIRTQETDFCCWGQRKEDE